MFVSYSPSLELMLESAVNEYDDLVRADGNGSSLRKLGGMMMLKTTLLPRYGMSNAEFCPTANPYHRISEIIETIVGF